MTTIRLLAILPEPRGYQAIQDYRAYDVGVYGPQWSFSRTLENQNVKLIVHFVLLEGNVRDCVVTSLLAIPDIRGIILLDTCVAYSGPTQIDQMADAHVLDLNQSLIIKSIFDPSGGSRRYEPHVNIYRAFHFGLGILGVTAIDAVGRITDEVFEQAREYSYLACVGDRQTEPLYRFADENSITTQVISITCAREYSSSANHPYTPVAAHTALSELIGLFSLIGSKDAILGYFMRQVPISSKINLQQLRPAAIPAIPAAAIPAAAVPAAAAVRAEKDELENEIDLLSKVKPTSQVERDCPIGWSEEVQSTIDKLQRQVRELEADNLKLVLRLSEIENAKNQSDREHIETLSAVINHRDKKVKGDVGEEKVEHFTCKMCCENEVNTIVTPCGHASICSRCSDTLRANPASPCSNKCVICQGQVERVVKFIIS